MKINFFKAVKYCCINAFACLRNDLKSKQQTSQYKIRHNTSTPKKGETGKSKHVALSLVSSAEFLWNESTVQSRVFHLPADPRGKGDMMKWIKNCTLRLKLPGKEIRGGPRWVDRYLLHKDTKISGRLT